MENKEIKKHFTVGKYKPISENQGCVVTIVASISFLITLCIIPVSIYVFYLIRHNKSIYQCLVLPTLAVLSITGVVVGIMFMLFCIIGLAIRSYEISTKVLEKLFMKRNEAKEKKGKSK